MLPTIDEMEEDDDDGIGVDDGQEDGEPIVNRRDVELLERMHLSDVEEPSGPPPGYVEDWWYNNRDSDDDDDAVPSYDPNNVDNGF